MTEAVGSIGGKRGRGRERRSSEPANPLMFIFWTLAGLFAFYSLVTAPRKPLYFTGAAWVVGFGCFYGLHLWCSRKVTGLPLFPIFAFTCIPTHALQFILAEPKLQEHSAEAIWRAALTVCGFLLCGTMTWHFTAKLPKTNPRSCLVLQQRKGTPLLIIVLLLAAVFTVFDHAAWLGTLPGGVVTAARGLLRGPSNFAIFVLSLRWGSGYMSRLQTSNFLGAFVLFLLAECSSLFLVGGVIACLMLIVGLVLGGRKIPWIIIGIMIVVIGAMHIGKGEMRSRYWAEGGMGNTLEPWNYPSYYADWAEASMDQLARQKQGADENQSVFSRVNTVYLLLQAQEMAPDEVPFMGGATYTLIPSAVVPRLLNANKASPHESTSMLNVHFGNQTWEATQTTSIGWGMMNEAYANFGYIGCFILAVLLGSFYGLISRMSIGLPPGSLQTLVGIFTLAFALQTEMPAAVFITAYIQGIVALLLISFFFAERISLASGKLRSGQEPGRGLSPVAGK